jgi:Aspartyl protease/PDZ domain
MRVAMVSFLLFSALGALPQEAIKITVVNDVALVPLRVNGRELKFLLDTGSEWTVLDASVASELKLPELGTTQVARNYRERVTGTVKASNMESGTFHLGARDLAVMDLMPISRAVNGQVDGVLGNDILQDFTFKLNYSKQLIVFGPLDRLGELGKPITMRRSGDQYFVRLSIVSLPTELLLDTGTNSTNLSWNTWQTISQVWHPDSMVDGVARAGAAAPNEFLVCVPSLDLGANKITDQPIRVQRAVPAGVFSDDGFGGILGSDVLRHFEVAFDLKHHTLYLKKDPHFRSDPYRYVTVGIQFARNDQGTYSVMSVWKNSPADEAGIRLGDRITAVNGGRSSSLTTEQLSNQLHGPVGTPINMIMERDGNLSTATLRTRQMLCSNRDHTP